MTTVDLSFDKSNDPTEYLVKSMKGGDDRYVMDMIYDLTVQLVEQMPSLTQCEKPHQHQIMYELLSQRIVTLYNMFIRFEEE